MDGRAWPGGSPRPLCLGELADLRQRPVAARVRADRRRHKSVGRPFRRDGRHLRLVTPHALLVLEDRRRGWAGDDDRAGHRPHWRCNQRGAPRLAHDAALGSGVRQPVHAGPARKDRASRGGLRDGAVPGDPRRAAAVPPAAQAASSGRSRRPDLCGDLRDRSLLAQLLPPGHADRVWPAPGSDRVAADGCVCAHRDSDSFPASRSTRCASAGDRGSCRKYT